MEGKKKTKNENINTQKTNDEMTDMSQNMNNYLKYK